LGREYRQSGYSLVDRAVSQFSKFSTLEVGYVNKFKFPDDKAGEVDCP
jgi:hypothetical protein